MSLGVLVPNPGRYLGMTVIYVKSLRILPGTYEVQCKCYLVLFLFTIADAYTGV